MKRDKERKKNQRNREFVEEGEAVLEGERGRGGRTLEIRDGPEIAPDPAFWLKDVSDSTLNAFESPNAPDVPDLPNRYERG